MLAECRIQNPTAPSASFKLEKKRDGQNTEEVGKITIHKRVNVKEDRTIYMIEESMNCV